MNSVAYFSEMLNYEQLEHATKSGVSVWNRSGPITQPIKLEHFDWASRLMRSNLQGKSCTNDPGHNSSVYCYSLMVGLQHEAFVYMFTCLCSIVIRHVQFWYKQVNSKQFKERLCNISGSDRFFFYDISNKIKAEIGINPLWSSERGNKVFPKTLAESLGHVWAVFSSNYFLMWSRPCAVLEVQWDSERMRASYCENQLLNNLNNWLMVIQDKLNIEKTRMGIHMLMLSPGNHLYCITVEIQCRIKHNLKRKS